MLTTFNATMSRSSRVLWLLEELEAAYSLVPVAIKRPDGGGGPDPNNLHPLRQVPCLLDDGEIIVESLAIWLHLADAHPAAGLAPAVGHPDRARYMGWMGAATAVLEPLVDAILSGDPTSDRLASARTWLSGRIETALSAAPWLMGERLAPANIDPAMLNKIRMFRPSI